MSPGSFVVVDLAHGAARRAAVASRPGVMSTFRKLLLLVLVVTHLLVGGGALVTCVEQDGGRATELALSACCERPTPEAPRTPATPSITQTSDDCGACIDELVTSPAARPCSDAPGLVIPPASLPDATVELDIEEPAPLARLATLPPDTTPRRMRPALLRP